MSLRSLVLTVLMATLLTVPAVAELQSVAVGGELRIRGNYYNWDSAFDDQSFVEQRTRLNVRADFSEDVAFFLEIDSYDIWGEDFRSDYVTGSDFRAVSTDDIEIYQAYVEAREMWGVPVRLRVGRQELPFGSGWLIGTNDSSSRFYGLSFDALRVTYATDMFSVDAFAAKMAENFGNFGEDDEDLYGLYASYLGLEDAVIDLYWFFLNDETGVIGNDTDLHTVGLRAAGVYGAFDFELEVAKQFGEIEWNLGDFDYDEWAVNAEAGYTIDTSWQPRVYLGFAYLGGDTDDLSFNRLYSNWEYSEFLDNTDLSNVLIYRAGLRGFPAERLELGLDLSYFETDDQLTRGWPFGWWKSGGDTDLGFEARLQGTYRYTDDLVFRVGWAHFFAGDGIEEGNFISDNGFTSFSSDSDDDYDYLYLETKVAF